MTEKPETLLEAVAAGIMMVLALVAIYVLMAMVSGCAWMPVNTNGG